MGGWNGLPSLALLQVLRYLSNEEVVAAGQTCRAWRTVAKLPCAWRLRTLCYDPDPEQKPGTKRYRDWHSNAKHFTRVILFAPVLAVVRCARSLKTAARKAVSATSECKVRACELNGQNQWSVKYLRAQRGTLEAVLLLNPKTKALTEALRLPRLASLEVAWEDDNNRHRYKHHPLPVEVLPLPAGTEGCPTLHKLTCRHGVMEPATSSLLRANAATLQSVSVSCLPPPWDALRGCAKLKRLALRMQPGNKAQEDALRGALQGKALDGLVFHDMWEHSSSACSSLRASLQPLVRGAVRCEWCAAPLGKRRAPARLPPPGRAHDDLLYFFDGFDSGPYGFGGCNCLSCCTQWIDLEDLY